MKAIELLKRKGIKDTLYVEGNWIKEGLSALMELFEEQQNKELSEDFNELKSIIYVNDEECRYDHNGRCQTHNMTQKEDYKCPMIRIRELISKTK